VEGAEAERLILTMDYADISLTGQARQSSLVSVNVYYFKLLWFKNDCKHHVQLRVYASTDNSFAITATHIALTSSTTVSGEKENLIIPTQHEIGEDILQKMENPKSRFLLNQCDFVIFEDSPVYQAKYSN
jgi:hypothetical protein